MAIEDLVAQQPAEETPPSDDSVVTDEQGVESADTTTEENVSEGYVDDVLGNLDEVDIKDRTRNRIQELASERNELLERAIRAEAAAEAAKSVKSEGSTDEKPQSLEDYPIETLERELRNSDYDDDQRFLIMSALATKKAEAKLEARFTSQSEAEAHQAQIQAAGQLAEAIAGKDIFDPKSNISKLADTKLATVQSTFSDLEATQIALAAALAKLDQTPAATKLQRDNQRLARSQMIEGSARAASASGGTIKDFLNSHKDGLGTSKQGQQNGSLRGAIKQLNLVKQLQDE